MGLSLGQSSSLGKPITLPEQQQQRESGACRPWVYLRRTRNGQGGKKGPSLEDLLQLLHLRVALEERPARGQRR